MRHPELRQVVVLLGRRLYENIYSFIYNIIYYRQFL